MIVLIDQDGVLVDFELGFFQAWRKKFPDELFTHIEDRKSKSLFGDYPENLREKIRSVYQAPGFYINLPPIPNGRDVVREIIKLGHDVFICTTSMSHFENCLREKYEWVERYLGREFTKRIIIAKDKTLVRGTYLIDDCPTIKGLLKPEWEHIIFDAPYNKKGGCRRIKNDWSNWKEVLNLW